MPKDRPASKLNRLAAGWRRYEDARCFFSLRPKSGAAAAVLSMLTAENALGLECKVIKHPDCCAVCAANERCDAIPLHHWCRCKRGVGFTSGNMTSK